MGVYERADRGPECGPLSQQAPPEIVNFPMIFPRINSSAKLFFYGILSHM